MLSPARLRLVPRKSPSRPPVTRAAAQSRGYTRRKNTQQSFDLQHAPAANLPLVDSGIYCDVPVALPMHRFIAAAADASMILVGLALFLAVFYLSGGDLVLSKQTAPFLVGAGMGVALLYRLLWCLGNGDTPGMRFAGLRVVNFDGRAPNREQRTMRQVAHLVSLVSAGLGLLWALVDEENLTWHDHISKTFPTAG